MKLGSSLCNNQGVEDVQAIVRLAIRAGELGFGSIWASDRVFNVGHVFERIGDKPYYDPLTARPWSKSWSGVRVYVRASVSGPQKTHVFIRRARPVC